MLCVVFASLLGDADDLSQQITVSLEHRNLMEACFAAAGMGQ